MIIVEGPDGSGKTTLIEQLGYERRHLRALRAGRGADGDKKQGWGAGDEAPVAYARQILQANWDEKIDRLHYPTGICPSPKIAFDRFHVSEQVYGPLLRGESGITAEETTILRRLLNARGIPVVVCLPPIEHTLKNVVAEGRERPAYQTEDFLRRAHDRFALLAEQSWLLRRDGYLTFDYTQHGPIVARIQMDRRICPPDVIGSPTARYLIVGEKSNLPLDLPFFSMEGSSGYLNRALWYAGFCEEELAFTNAYASDGRPRDLRACLLASTQFIVTLGIRAHGEATEQLRDNRQPILTAPDPLFWRRMDDHEGYVDRLKEICEATR